MMIYLDLLLRGEKITESELNEFADEVIRIDGRESHIGLPVKGKVLRLETCRAKINDVCLSLVEQTSFWDSRVVRREFASSPSEVKDKLTVLLGRAGLIAA